MKAAFQHVREHGGVCIADEVQVCSLCECVVLPASAVSFNSIMCCCCCMQVGFGRVGSAFWGFQLQDGAVPDIVTMGKRKATAAAAAA